MISGRRRWDISTATGEFPGWQESTGTLGKRHPLAFILEAADDIAYKTADIEDAVKKGCISYERLLAELKAYKAGSQTNHYVQIVSWLEEKYGRPWVRI